MTNNPDLMQVRLFITKFSCRCGEFVTPGHCDRRYRFGAAILHDLPTAVCAWRGFFKPQRG
jgi:hypothetical protein